MKFGKVFALYLVTVCFVASSSAMSLAVQDKTSDVMKYEFRISGCDLYDKVYHYTYQKSEDSYYTLSLLYSDIGIEKGISINSDSYPYINRDYKSMFVYESGFVANLISVSFATGIIDYSKLERYKFNITSVGSEFTYKELYELFAGIQSGSVKYIGKY